MGIVRRLPRADDDLIEIWSYIARDSATAADRVLDAVERTLELLLERPEIGVRHATSTERLAEVRFFPVSKFRRYLIYYRPTPDGIELIRVLHGARDRQGLILDEE